LILKGCFNAQNYKNLDKKTRDRDKNLTLDYKYCSQSTFLALKQLKRFIKDWSPYLDEFKYSIIKDLNKNGGKITNEVIDEVLISLEKHWPIDPSLNLKDKVHPHWYKIGCLYFNKPRRKNLKNPARDGLIFEITFYLRLYLRNDFIPFISQLDNILPWPLPITKPQMGTHYEIIANFVNSSLSEKITVSKVKKRLIYLENHRAMLGKWNIYDNFII
jgi:hypothetical protein